MEQAQQEYDLAKFDKVMADMATIKEKANFLPDCSTPEGYDASKRLVLDITTPARTKLTAVHKETKAPFLAACKLLDAKKSELMPLLDELEAPHRLAYKAADKEAKEKKQRFDAELEAKVQTIFEFRNQILGCDSTQIETLLTDLEAINTAKGFHHRKTDAIATKEVSLHILTNALAKTREAETTAIEQAKIAEEQRIEAKRLADIQAGIDAEKAKLEAERVERERIENEKVRADAKIEREKREARMKEAQEKQAIIDKELKEKAEAKRKADEETARVAHEAKLAELAQKRADELKAETKRIEDERIEAENKLRESRTKNRNKAVKVLVADCGVDKKTALAVLQHVTDGHVPFVTANF